jgi:hypothetical protein
MAGGSNHVSPHLLGLEDDASETREDLFAAWRLFFERLADRGPTVVVFETCSGADSSLLDFIEYLLALGEARHVPLTGGTR